MVSNQGGHVAKARVWNGLVRCSDSCYYHLWLVFTGQALQPALEVIQLFFNNFRNFSTGSRLSDSSFVTGYS